MDEAIAEITEYIDKLRAATFQRLENAGIITSYYQGSPTAAMIVQGHEHQLMLMYGEAIGTIREGMERLNGNK